MACLGSACSWLPVYFCLLSQTLGRITAYKINKVYGGYVYIDSDSAYVYIRAVYGDDSYIGNTVRKPAADLTLGKTTE